MQKFQLTQMRSVKEAELSEVKALLKVAPPRSRQSYSFVPDKNSISVIAEVKKSSPTEKLNLSANVQEQALAYERGGAVAISVLTDSNYFSGSYEDMRTVAKSVSLPVLCKEFVYFEEQIELAYRYGADLILLVAQTLSDKELAHLYNYACERNVVPIVEINEASEIDRVMKIDPAIVMVNMRNLNTLDIDIEYGKSVLEKVPLSVIRISASGIKRPTDVLDIASTTAVSTFLIGSSLMKSGSPDLFLKELLDVH